MTLFKDLALAAPIARAVSDLGYETPSPIQAQAIPHLLRGRDLLGIAQTGTGKTAAFALPTLDYLYRESVDAPKRGARVLVLAPTRELVAQIADSFQSYGRFMEGLSVGRVVGGVSLQKQIKSMVQGRDILVATPGRLIDLLDRKAIRLDKVEVLILDEADQMMDMGFIKPLRKIAGHLPADRQSLFFSATMSAKIRSLADSFLTDPVSVSVTPANTTAERVTQSLIFVEKTEKPMVLADILVRKDVGRTLVFTRTKHGADRVVRRLGQVGISALAIHGNRTQGQRQRALAAFTDGKVDVLVATDVAARGIDIPEITHVINYEIPNVPEQYVHRIGRTARAGAAGEAIALVQGDERPYLRDIQKLLGETIEVEPLPDDMAARVKAIEARPKVERVDISPEPQPRKGRGKSRKKKRAGAADRKSGKPQAGARERGAKPQEPKGKAARKGSGPSAAPSSKPKAGRGPARSKEALARKPRRNPSQRNSGQGNPGQGKKASRSQTRRKAPPRR